MEIEYTYNQYVDDILTGRIKSCEAIYLACERYKAFMNRSDMYFDEEDVQRKIRVVARLKHSTGIHNGKSFILLPWQQWCIASIFGFKWKSTGYRVTKNAFIMISRKSGKALSIDTPIPTPEGCTTMGSLKVGDQVFDENGKPCNVTFVTPVMYDHKCYNITFSDGEVITADADHNWYVQRYRSKWHVETTREIIDNGYCNKRKDGYVEKYVCVPAAKPFEYKSTSTLPIDPYTLGLWLGDGCKNKPKLTLNGDDCSELVSHIPYPYTLERYDDENAYDVNLSGKQQSDFSKLLIINGLKGNKHIPEEYFFASVNDRLALLQGIMDADGSISISKTNGSAKIEIQQVNENLAKGICRLLDSLCIKYYARKRIPTINGKPCNEVTRITFNGDKTLPVFRLKRKYDLLPDRKGKRYVKYITKIEETESVPVKCITVDSPNHLYLCGKNTVTHNTATAAAIGILCAIADNEPGAEIDLVANSRHQAKIAFTQSSNFCESVDKNKKIFKRYRDTINIPKTKSIIQVLSSDAMGNDGYNASCFILDEFHAARSWDLYNVLKSSQGSRSQPLSIIITSAGFLLNGYPCYEHRQTCIDILKGNKVDDTQFSAIYELDEEDDWLDEDNWIKCAPSLGQTVQIDYLRDQVQSVKNNPSLETGVKTKNFNIFCQSKNVWIPEKYLKDVWHKVDVDNFIDEDCYMGVDLSSVSDITASAIMFPPNPERAIYPDKYVFKPYVYLPVDNLAENTNEELYRLWYRQGFLDCTPGNVVDYDQILKDQIEIYNKTYLHNVAYDEWNASSWASDAYAEGLPIKGYSQTVGNFNKPTKMFEMLIRSGKVIIDYNPLVRWCFNNVEIKMDVNGNCKPMKGGSSNRKADRNGTNTKKIDPIIAMLEALGGYLDKHMNGVSDGQVLSV